MPQRKHKLLVVDDEFFNRDMLKERLLRSGYEVTEAEDALEALAIVDRGGIDLVLLDVMMPGMTGIDLLRLLRRTYSPSELPVIMATAISDSENVAGALDLGANDYVSKPIDFRVALARIQSQLKRKDAERRLRESEERYALASRGTDDGIWDWDLLANRVYYSPRWRATAGVLGPEIGEAPEEWLQRVHPADVVELRQRLQAHSQAPAATEKPFYCEYRMLHRDGSYHWMRGSAHTVRDRSGKAVRMTGTQTDITEQKVHDSLTGLANRLLFQERAGHSIDQAARNEGAGFVVLFLDIDRFKLINDTMGHLAGDDLLVRIADRLRQVIRGDAGSGQWDNFTVARFGGDEFAVLLDIGPNGDTVDSLARRVLNAFSEAFPINGKEIYCSVSMGIAVWSPAYQSVEDLLRDADTAMYAAKARGGAAYVVFDETMRQHAEARLEIETGLRRAIERNELVVYYQAKVNLERNSLVGFEALLRWNHPTLGLVSPSDFIPIAEETGQIVAIGEWVLRAAGRQMVEWQRQYPKVPPLTVSVNLSTRQFRQPDLVELVASILAETGLKPEYLQLEITESVVMDDPDAAIQTTRRLKALGVGIKLDDFGTGYSGLSYLCRMPIDTLKIDRSFILRMRDSSIDLEIVRTILALAHSLGLDVVAEGVERIEQMSQLRSLGCQFGQGYYFGRPIPPEETELLLVSTGVDGSLEVAGLP